VGQLQPYTGDGEQAVCRRVAFEGPALIVLVGGAYTALMIAFGFGVWASAHRNRALRVTGALLIAYGAANILRTFFPLDLNNDASGSNAHCGYEHAAHIDAGCHNLRGRGVHGWLRVCSIASLVTSIVAGIVSFMGTSQLSVVSR